MKKKIVFALLCLSAFAQAQRRSIVTFLDANDGTKIMVDYWSRDTVAHYSFIDEPTVYSELIIVHNSLSATTSVGGIVDKYGNIVLPLEYENLNLSSINLVEAQKNGKYGLITLNGEIIIPFEYDALTISPLLKPENYRQMPDYFRLMARFDKYPINLNGIVARKGEKNYLINYKNEVLAELPTANGRGSTFMLQNERYVYQFLYGVPNYIFSPLTSPWLDPKVVDAHIKNDTLILHDVAGGIHHFTDTMYYYITDSIMAIGNLTDGYRLCNTEFQSFTPYYKNILPHYEDDAQVEALWSNNSYHRLPPNNYGQHPLSAGHGHSVTDYPLSRPRVLYFTVGDFQHPQYLDTKGQPLPIQYKKKDIDKSLLSNNLHLFQEKDKMGLMDTNDNVLLTAEYTYIGAFNSIPTWLICIKNDSIGFYNTKIYKKIDCKYQNYALTNDKNLAIWNRKTGLILDSLGVFLDTLNPSKLPAEITNVGTADLRKIAKGTFRIVLPFGTIKIRYLSHKYWLLTNYENKQTLYDSLGTMLFPGIYNYFTYNSLTLTISGERIATNPELPTKIDRWAVRNDTLERLPDIDYSKHTTEYPQLRPEKNGMIIYQNEQFYEGVMDKNKKRITPPIYDHVSDFDTNGFALFRKNNQYGWLNKAGKSVYPALFDTLLQLINGEIYILEKGAWRKIKIEK